MAIHINKKITTKNKTVLECTRA